MKRHLLALISACAFGAAVLAGPAGADPIHAKNASQIHALCGTQTVNVVVNGGNGNGAFLPAHVLGSTSMFIPTSVHLTFSFTPAGGGGPFVNTTNATKASPPKSGAVTCTIPLQTLFSGPQGSATIQGTVTGFYTPR
jgi:hypothetical protein